MGALAQAGIGHPSVHWLDRTLVLRVGRGVIQRLPGYLALEQAKQSKPSSRGWVSALKGVRGWRVGVGLQGVRVWAVC